jgi:hypothetical protein
MNALTWSHPPNDDAELALWKCYVSTTEQNVWDVVQRWLKRYGNPFEGDCNEIDWCETLIFRLAILYTYKK